MGILRGDQITIEVNDPSTPAGTTQTITVNSTGALTGATSIPVAALAGAMASGTVLTFTGNRVATLSAAVAAGAVGLPVLALAQAIPATNTATGPVVPALFVPVNDMNRFSRRNSRSTSRQRVFMRSRPYLTRGQRETTATISGLLNTTDVGQNALRTYMNTDAPVTLRILPDGTNGFLQDFYVNSTGNDATPDPADLQDASFELSEAGDPYVIGTGPIL